MRETSPEKLKGILNNVIYDMKSPMGMLLNYSMLLEEGLNEQDHELIEACVNGIQGTSKSVSSGWQMIREHYFVESPASEARDEKLEKLVASMIHDFANPVVLVQGWTGELVKAHQAKDESFMRECNQNLAQTIQKLLDLYDWLLDEYNQLREQ